MKKNIVIVTSSLLLIGMITLTGCMGDNQKIMAPVGYNKTISKHSARVAYVYWKSGKQLDTTAHLHDLDGDALASAMVAVEYQSHPSEFTYSYGKAQQAVFMTSLEDVLQKNKVFKETSLQTAPRTLGPEDVAITINFKEAQVLHDQHNITLDIELVITDGQQHQLTKNIVVTSNIDMGFTSNHDFTDQLSDVSQQLMNRIMSDITIWVNEFSV